MANKLLKAGLLLVFSAAALIGCDDIYAHEQLKDYNNPVVTEGTDFDVNTYNNTMTSIYDDLHDGSMPSDVLNKILYKYSVSVFGRYNKLSEGIGNDEEVTLKEAANIATKAAAYVAANDGATYDAALSNVDSAGNFKKFVAAHPIAYQTKTDDKEDIEMEVAKVLAKWGTIEDRIAETMYDKISGGSYSFRSLFSEEKFVRSFVENMDPVKTDASVFYADQLIDPSYDKDEVFDYFLHRDYFQYNSGLDQDETADSNNEICYVEKSIIPTIYTNLLTEQYIIEKSYASVGRSYARKVNIIEVSDNSDAPLAVDYMINNYFANVNSLDRGFLRTPNGNSVKESTNGVTKQDFINVSDAVKGEDINNQDLTIMKSFANSPIKETDSFPGYFKGTEYGSVIEDYEDIYTDSSMYSTFSGSGKYSTETGLELKNREIALTTHVKSGWFVKEDLSSYPFADELFNLQVSVALDAVGVDSTGAADVDAYDRWYKDSQSLWTLGGRERDYNKYVCRINGAYYLKNTKNDSKDSDRDIVFYSGGKYYIVQILEAVSTSKVNEKSSSCYEPIKLEEVKTEILKIIGITGSYASSAKEYYLEKMDIKYHDQDVYDYFEENYPDLFEDD